MSGTGRDPLYQTEDGRTRVQVRIDQETVWLTQKQMGELFQKDVRTISEHTRNIFDEGELQPDSVVRKFRTTAADGKQYDTQHYNLDVIISVGYRVKSLRGTQFRTLPRCADPRRIHRLLPRIRMVTKTGIIAPSHLSGVDQA